jgi:CHAP domain
MIVFDVRPGHRQAISAPYPIRYAARTTMPRPVPRLPPALALLLALASCASQRVGDGRLMTCVPYARERAHIDLRGDGWQWWDAALGRYARDRLPEPGAVLVFDRSRRLSGGHVAVVSRVVSAREIRVDHANWDGERGGGPIATDQPVIDVSPNNDWSAVRVWFPPGGQLGITTFSTLGFIHPRPATRA